MKRIKSTASQQTAAKKFNSLMNYELVSISAQADIKEIKNQQKPNRFGLLKGNLSSSPSRFIFSTLQV